MTSVTSVTQKAADHGDVETIRDTSMAMKVLLETHRPIGTFQLLQELQHIL